MEQSDSSQRNMIGLQVKRIRLLRGLTQDQLAAKCQVAGLDISRSTLAKIEAGLRCATDHDVWQLSKVLRVPVVELFLKKR